MVKMEETSTIRSGAPYSGSSEEDVGARTGEPPAEKAAHGIRPYIASRKEHLVEQLNQTASALQQAGNQMPNHRSSELFRMSAERIGRLGDYLQVHEMDEVMDDFKAYAARRPWLVMGGAFLVGMAAARFFKASDTSPTAV